MSRTSSMTTGIGMKKQPAMNAELRSHRYTQYQDRLLATNLSQDSFQPFEDNPVPLTHKINFRSRRVIPRQQSRTLMH